MKNIKPIDSNSRLLKFSKFITDDKQIEEFIDKK